MKLESKLLKTTLLSLFVIQGTLLSSESFAFVGAEVAVGKRNYSFKNAGDTTTKTDATEFRAAVYLDPIPLVPVAFGAVLSSIESEKKDNFAAMKGLTFGLGVKAWFPLGDLKPYAKLTYNLYGKFTDDASAYDAVYDVKGLHMGAGLSWSPLPLIAILLECDIASSEDFETTEAKVGGVEVPKSAYDLQSSSMAFLLGAEVGF